MLSTLSQLSAELVGRSYGGGVLKLEPSEARRIELVMHHGGFPDASDVMKVVDAEMRGFKRRDVTALVDEEVLRKHLGLSSREIGSLRADLELLRQIRLGSRNGRSGKARSDPSHDAPAWHRG